MDKPAEPTWLEPFKGSTHSWLDCEILTLERVDPVLRESAWEATDEIWFDYVRLHPLKAFYWFCHCYSKAYGRYLEQNINLDLRFSRGLKGDPLDSRELRQLMAIKREADKRCIPYDFWLQELFKHFASIGWTRPPRPAHMAKAETAQIVVEQAWENRIMEYTKYASDPWYLVQNWEGHQHQRRYEDWIVGNLQLRTHKEYGLSYALYEHGALRIERAIYEFGKDVVMQAQRVFLDNNAISQQ